MAVFPVNQVKAHHIALTTAKTTVVGGDASRVALILSNAGQYDIEVYFEGINPDYPFIYLPTAGNPFVVEMGSVGDVVIQAMSASSKTTGGILLATEVVVD